METNKQITSLTERMFLFLEDSDWNKANEYCERILDEDSRNQNAYLGKLMIDYHLRKKSDLSNLKKDFEKNINYQRIVRFGDPEFVREIQQYLNAVKENIRKKELEAQQRKQQRQFERQNKPLGMKWYKFLIWFSLPMSVFIDLLIIIAAFNLGFSHTILLSKSKLDYIAYGIFYTGICFYTLVTWIKLCKFKKDAIPFLYGLFLINILFTIIDQIINGQFISVVSFPILYLIFVCLNMHYFEKRRAMFNDYTTKKEIAITTQEKCDADNADEQTESEDPKHCE